MQRKSGSARGLFDLHHYPLTNEMKKRYQDINAQLWSAYEEGEISREAVIYTRFGKLFREFGIADDASPLRISIKRSWAEGTI